MNFNSFEYILFLLGVYVLYWTWRNRESLRTTLLLVASYWFYSLADWRFCGLLLTSTVVDYVAGGRIHRSEDPRVRKRWLLASLGCNLGMLGFFKYWDFFVGSFEDLFARLGQEISLFHLSTRHGGFLDVAVPVGISFYTFQTLSYTIDIYRRQMKPARNLVEFAVFVSFFPQLVAGPIVRARHFVPQLERPAVLERTRVGSGLFQILRGMTKKLLMADLLGAHVVDFAYRDAETLSQLGAPHMMLATYAYALQLYGDFAGYTDIAIGSARLLGFELLKNFDAPFKSKSIEEFWRRWHISMSSWFRDYVFIGLGGSRGTLAFTCRNLFLTALLSGIWHGAGWNFVLWGTWFGVLNVVTILVRTFVLPRGKFPDHWVFSFLGVLFTFHCVWFSGLLFRCQDVASIRAACAQFVDWSKGLPELPWQIWTILFLGYFTHWMPDSWYKGLERGFVRLPSAVQGVVVLAAILLFFSLSPPGLTPFIYFRF